MANRVRVIHNRLDDIGDSIRKAVDDELLMDVAESVAERAASKSRRRTGFLKDSWQAELDKPGKAVAYSDDFKAQLHEYGTVYMSAQPMATPAAEEERARLGRKAKRAINKAAK